MWYNMYFRDVISLECGKTPMTSLLIITKSHWENLKLMYDKFLLYYRELYHEQLYFRPNISCTNDAKQSCIWTVIVIDEYKFGGFDWFYFWYFNATFNNISAISWQPVFSGGGSRSTQREPPTMGKQLVPVNFITCGCESSAPFFVIYKAGREPTPYWW